MDMMAQAVVRWVSRRWNLDDQSETGDTTWEGCEGLRSLLRAVFEQSEVRGVPLAMQRGCGRMTKGKRGEERSDE